MFFDAFIEDYQKFKRKFEKLNIPLCKKICTFTGFSKHYENNTFFRKRIILCGWINLF